jgi:aryl-alcohol dehydrogenase-like predicted oxidoreductase
VALLSGKYKRRNSEGHADDVSPDTNGSARWLKVKRAGADSRKVRKLAPVAADLGCTMAQMAIAWCLRNPAVSTVITGASRASQVSGEHERRSTWCRS